MTKKNIKYQEMKKTKNRSLELCLAIFIIAVLVSSCRTNHNCPAYSKYNTNTTTVG